MKSIETACSRPGGRLAALAGSLLLALFIAVVATPAGAQAGGPSPLSLKVMPAVNMPLGNDVIFFGTGGGAALSAELSLPFLPLFGVSGDLAYALSPLQNVSDAVSLVSLGLSAHAGFRPLPWLTISPFAGGGYFYGILPGTSTGGSAYLLGGMSVAFQLTSSLAIGLEAAYRNYLGLQSGMSFGVGPLFALGGAPGGRQVPFRQGAPLTPGLFDSSEAGRAPTLQAIRVNKAQLDPIFPVFYKYYDDHPVGTITILNSLKEPLEKVKVSFYVKEYMDNPKVCVTIARLEPGREATVSLIALFNDNMMDISEATKLSAMVAFDYVVGGAPGADEYSDTIRVYDRNASLWDDDRRAAAFVTAKDPNVMRFAKNIIGMTRDKGSKAVNENLLTAMAIHEALRLHDLQYVVDPASSYSETSKKKLAVDFLQFPRQTLEYKAGDCDDLSILYAALLESIGIETAFVTVPGHIFMAFSLGISPDAARKEFPRSDDLILVGGKSWLPIEVTLRDGSFLQAWQSGAKEWREFSMGEQARLLPIHEAWAVYEPVAFTKESGTLAIPDKDRVVAAYLEELVRFIDREIYPQVTKMREEIQRSGGSPQAINRLGVLYARYGLNDRAREEFAGALKKAEYVPALINMGNLFYLDGNIRGALAYYQRAQGRAPNNPNVLLAIARANHELENYAVARESYDRLKKADPALAAQFSYLEVQEGDAARAANVAKVREAVLWDEQE